MAARGRPNRGRSSGGRGYGESLVLKRRQREQELASYSDCVKGLSSMNSRADWEHSLHVKSEDLEARRIMEELKSKEDAALHARRLRLAELYNREAEEWKQAILSNVETPEDRKQKMIKRALELKTRREQERMQIVEEKLMQQYRESCDDLRVDISKKRQALILSDRDKQLEERKAILEHEKKLEEEMARLWEEDRLKKEERDRRDVAEAEKRNTEMKNILDLQVNLVQKRRDEEEQKRREEEQAQLREWKRHKQMDMELEEDARRKEIARATDVKRFNLERSAVAHATAEREKQHDLNLLHEAIARETEAERRERELQEKFKQEKLEYQRMLKSQMEIEAEDTSHLDKIRQAMEESVWAKRDAQHNAEAAAREELLRRVLESREEQMKRKKEEAERRTSEDRKYMEALERESEEALQRELREQESRKEQMKKAQMDLLQQKQEKAKKLEHLEQANFLELKRMQLAEKRHKERVQQLTNQQEPSTNFRRKAAQWYFDA